MPFIPQADSSIPMRVENPLDLEAKGFALGQEMTQAERQTEQYNLQKKNQRALQEAFRSADTSTPEGQSDLVRKVGQFDPATARNLAQQFQKGALEQAQTREAQAKTQEAQSRSSLLQTEEAQKREEEFQKYRASASSFLGNLAQTTQAAAGNSLPGTPTYDKALQKANEEIDKQTQVWQEQFGGSKPVMEHLSKVKGHDFDSIKDLSDKAQSLKASLAGQAPPKPSESPIGRLFDDFNAGKFDRKTLQQMVEKEVHIPVPQAIITANLLDPEAVKTAADQFNLNGSLPPALSRNPAAVAKILDEAAKHNAAGGITGADAAVNRDANKADAKSLANLTKQSDMISSFEKTAEKNLSLMVAQSAKVPRSEIPLLNKGILTGKLEGGSTETAKYFAIVYPFTMEYAKILGGQTGAAGATDASRKEAREILSPYYSNETIKGLEPFIKQELNNRTSSNSEQIASIQKRMHDRVTGAKPEKEGGKITASSRDDLQKLISSGKLKSGDTFYDPDGNPHTVK
jgi:hypothetical protein